MTLHLFVYGTLRRGSPHPMAQFLAQRARYVAGGRIQGRLYNFGRYPGLKPSTDNADWVVGDLYELHNEAIWAELDRYEDAESPQPGYFERELAAIALEDGSETNAWVYWFRGEVREGQHIASGDYLEKKE
ncbi:MAG: gamma-glutamylcyclotransferase [Gemmataceae bacterium]|nr:gamma-glutamylcyclotransferase [Gemmataceae bacterium]